jgi:two-component system LytT family response regulator
MKVFRIPVPDPAVRISIRSGCTSLIIPPFEILYCSADNNYTCFHLVDGSTCLSYQSLSQVRKKLEPHGFVLIHKSSLVNFQHIRGFSVNGNGLVTLSSNVTLSISRRCKTQLQELFKTGQ